MIDLWSAIQWWDEWQLRILVLGSLGIQWFLMLAAPMRQYGIQRWFRICIWLAYITSDALAIYALATLFNRHARASSSSSSTGDYAGRKENALEILWAPVLLIHLGGQVELTAYNIEDNELWTRHTVTLVSQVTVALYAFYKSWPSSGDRRLLASAVLLFIIGVFSFSEKPWALRRASIYRLVAVSSRLEGKIRNTSKWAYCFTALKEGSTIMDIIRCGKNKQKEGDEKSVQMSDRDKVHMILSDMSLLAADHELKERRQHKQWGDFDEPATEDKGLGSIGAAAETELKRWLRNAFRLIYTRVNVVRTPAYMVYHLVMVPCLHMAAITLFAMSHKHSQYNGTDVKMTYIILCFTAALDVLAVFIRELLYLLMFKAGVPALCETIPQYNNLISSVLWRMQPTLWLFKWLMFVGYNEGYFASECKQKNYYNMVRGYVIIELAKAEDRDLASYRSFTERNWALNEELQQQCGPEIRRSLERLSFDRSVLLWHIATDLCLSRSFTTRPLPNPEEDHHPECTKAISNYMAHLLNVRPDMLMTGSRQHLFTDAMDEVEEILKEKDEPHKLSPEDLATHILEASKVAEGGGERPMLDGEREIEIEAGEAARGDIKIEKVRVSGDYIHIPAACRLAQELMDVPAEKRWDLMYHVWVGMLCYSASMCRGYLHAKTLGEGGEFLSFIWLLLSGRKARTLADKLQMPDTAPDRKPQRPKKRRRLFEDSTTIEEKEGQDLAF